MALAPSLPIQCKQIHEAPSVLSPVQIKSTGMRWEREGCGVALAWSTQLLRCLIFALKSLFCNKNFASSLIWGLMRERAGLSMTCGFITYKQNTVNPIRKITCHTPCCGQVDSAGCRHPKLKQWVQWELYIWHFSLTPMGASIGAGGATYKQRVHSSPGGGLCGHLEGRCAFEGLHLWIFFFLLLQQTFPAPPPCTHNPPARTPAPKDCSICPCFGCHFLFHCASVRLPVRGMEESPQPLRINSWGAEAQGSTGISLFCTDIKTHSVYKLPWGASRWHWFYWFTGCRIELKS